MEKTPGQAAFEEWSSALKTGAQWRFVPEDNKKRWERIADAAINCHIEQCEEGPRVDPPE